MITMSYLDNTDKHGSVSRPFPWRQLPTKQAGTVWIAFVLRSQAQAGSSGRAGVNTDYPDMMPAYLALKQESGSNSHRI